MHLGPSEDHVEHAYRFMSMETKRVILSRDVKWLNKNYGQWKRGNNPQVVYDKDEMEKIIPKQETHRQDLLKNVSVTTTCRERPKTSR